MFDAPDHMCLITPSAENANAALVSRRDLAERTNLYDRPQTFKNITSVLADHFGGTVGACRCPHAEALCGLRRVPGRIETT